MLKSLYEHSDYKDILNEVTGIYIPLDPFWKNIGVAVSGGADSALLTYILCSIIQEKNPRIVVHIISNIRMWKSRPWQRYNSLDVYDWMIKKFPNLEFRRHENFVAPDLEWGDKGPTIIDEYGQSVSGDIVELRSFAEYIGHREKLDAYYNAVTKNPTANFEGRLVKRDLESSEDNFHLVIKKHMDGLACHPFRFVDKSWIYQQYRIFEIMDLFEITRSCEGDFADLNYKNYVPGQYVPICGKCFWCKEREWAIEQSK